MQKINFGALYNSYPQFCSWVTFFMKRTFAATSLPYQKTNSYEIIIRYFNLTYR